MIFSQLFICAFFTIIIMFIDGQPPWKDPNKILPHKRHRQHLDQESRNLIRESCRGRCRGQPEWAKRRKSDVRRHLLRKSQRQRSEGEVDQQLDQMYQAKKAIFAAQGLDQIVEPINDGLFARDLILNQQQSQSVIQYARGLNNTADEAPDQDQDFFTTTLEPFIDSFREKGKGKGKGRGGHWRKKRAASLSLDQFSANKWPSAKINYFTQPGSFSSTEMGIIRAALNSIESKTCIRFIASSADPKLVIVRADKSTDSGTCGWAYMGYQPNEDNNVFINFDSDVCRPTIQGSVAHEVLHTLGFSHEHQRYDRDKFLTIDWKNVDPQSLDTFQKDDPFQVNPYCIPYDYESIMHYDCYVAAKVSGKPAAIPKTNSQYYLSKIGNYILPSKNDIALINKLYCGSPTCKDISPYCGYSCSECSSKYGRSCRKSCNTCSTN